MTRSNSLEALVCREYPGESEISTWSQLRDGMQACATPPLDIKQGARPNFEEKEDPTTISTTSLIHVVMEGCITHENELWKGLEVAQGKIASQRDGSHTGEYLARATTSAA
jgi:hypothetical protein